MRRLIYVPIIHSDPDLGMLAEGIEERTKVVVGSYSWQKHKEVVRLYWQEITKFWQGKKVSGFKIFQDGMPADGAIGESTVKSLAEKGSINYQIVQQLLENGAILEKTEDPELLKEEYFLTRELTEKKSVSGSLSALFRYRQRKDTLLRSRDRFIINRIKQSLEEEETGVCFLGAYHQVWSNLPKDIEVILLKDPVKVREYYQKLTSSKSEKEVERLGSYLIESIKVEISGSDE
jgi:hypothetical protein